MAAHGSAAQRSAADGDRRGDHRRRHDAHGEAGLAQGVEQEHGVHGGACAGLELAGVDGSWFERGDEHEPEAVGPVFGERGAEAAEPQALELAAGGGAIGVDGAPAPPARGPRARAGVPGGLVEFLDVHGCAAGGARAAGPIARSDGPDDGSQTAITSDERGCHTHSSSGDVPEDRRFGDGD